MTTLMMVYNFLADKNNWDKVSTEEQLSEECKKRFLVKRSSTINISDLSVLGTVYTWGTSQHQILGGVKEVNGKITEHYTKPPENFNSEWVALDIETDEILEYYLYDTISVPSREMKYSKDGELLQVNYGVKKFDDLPEEYKIALDNFSDKNKIFVYAKKPYGMIVEIDHTNLMAYNYIYA